MEWEERSTPVVRHLVGLGSAILPGPAGRLAFRAFCHPPKRPDNAGGGTRPPKIMQKARREALDFPAAPYPDAVPLYIWSPKDAPTARILLVHGWTSEAAHFAAFIPSLLRTGAEVLAIDLPAHGASTARTCHLPVAAQAISEIDARHGLDVVIGHSFGALAVCLASEGGTPLTRRCGAERLVLLNPPTAMRKITAGYANAIGLAGRALPALNGALEAIGKRSIDAFTTAGLLSRSEAEVLVIHDRDDEIISPAASRALPAARARTAFLETEGLGHHGVLSSIRVVKAVSRFASAARAAA